MPFLNDLKMKGVRGKRGITLLANLEYFSTRYGVIIDVPKGTYSNFGSEPAVVPPWIAPRVGKIKDAYVVHDYLYETKGEKGKYTRYQSDMILNDAMKDLGVWWWRRKIIIAGVRSNIIMGMKWDYIASDA